MAGSEEGEGKKVSLPPHLDCDELLNYYTRERLNLIPLIHGDKKPAIKTWKEYQQRRITEEEIKNFFLQGAQHNIGVVCGAISDNLYVLDFDTEEIFHKYFTKTDGLTLVKTGRGYHVYFKAESPVKTLKMLDSEGREIATLKGEGSYVVGPPSLHPSGAKYKFIQHGRIPRLTGDVRQQVKEHAIELGLTVPKEKIDLETLLKGVPAGNRDNSLMYLIHFLRRAGISKEDALKICKAWNKRNKPPLEDVSGKVDYHYGLAESYRYFYSLDPGLWNITEALILEKKKKSKTSKKALLREQQISDTAEIMEVLKQRYNFITANDTKTIYYYKDGIFEEATTLIEAEAEAHFNDTNSTYFTNEIINHLRRETYTNRDVFNADKTRIPLKNGLFNLKTFEIEPFDENKIFTFRVPIVYDAKAECPNIEAWIKEIVNVDSLNLLQEFCGYGFEPRLPLHKTLWLHGSGRNGKGAFMRLYKKAIGRQNGSTIPLEQMSAKFRFVLIRLLDKLVNVCSEPQSNYVFQTETFKKITGGDEIEGEIKGLQKTVSFTSFAKLFIMGNKYPNIDDNTIGFWERMEIVSFPNDYSDNFIPDIEDKKISADGGEEQALGGFFNWCMAGLKRLKESEYKLSKSKSSEETRLEFEKVSNSIRAFVTECVKLKPSEKYPKPALWNDYKDYCDTFELQIQQKSIFTNRIGELRGVTLKPAKKDGKTQKFWFGLTFKGCEEDESAEEGEKVKDKKRLSKLPKLPNFNTTHGEHKNIKKIEENIDNDIGGYIQKPTTLTTLATSEEKIFCVCGKRFDTVEVLIHHQTNCKDFQDKQSREARRRLGDDRCDKEGKEGKDGKDGKEDKEDISLESKITSLTANITSYDKRGASIEVLVNRIAIDSEYGKEDIKTEIDRLLDEGKLKKISQDKYGTEFIKFAGEVVPK